MVVALILPSTDPRTLQRLVVVEGRQNAKDDWNARVQLNPHQRMGNGVANVLKVHSCTLDEHTDGDDRIKRPSQVRRRGVVGCGLVEPKQIRSRRFSLYLGT